MAESQDAEVQLPPDDVGSRLRAAREAAGLSRTDIAQRTKIPERHIVSIEAGNFDALAGRSYATGFTRTYARAVGLNAEEIVAAVRREIGASEAREDRRATVAFEPGDPTRIPGRRAAWLAAALGVVLVLASLFFWRSYFSPAVDLPSPLAEETAAPVQSAGGPSQSAVSPATAQGAVTFTAREEGVWVRFRDTAGNQLLQKELALGEVYTVPQDVQGVTLSTGRPDALRVAIGGREVPPLAARRVTLQDVPVTAAALLARGSEPARGASAPAAAASPRAPMPSPESPSPAASPMSDTFRDAFAPPQDSTVSD